MALAKVFRDPVHTNIVFERGNEVEELVLDLIDTPEVQRLRHIRQLALANLVYHGAEHSRFSHSLGVTHFAKRLFRSATANAGVAHSPTAYATVLAGAILHDIGHAPFSHAFEKILKVDHEALTAMLLQGETKVHEVLVAFGGPGFVSDVVGHITGDSESPTAGIVSSQLDADRMDYVLRDGYHGGVKNSGYDSERIIQMARFDDVGVVFDYRAQAVIESYFIARYHLYLQLYYHKTNRAAEVILRQALLRAKDLFLQGILDPVDETLAPIFTERAAETAVTLTDHDLWSAFRLWQSHHDPILADLCRRLYNRDLFKSVEIREDNVVQYFTERHEEVFETVRKGGFDPAYYAVIDRPKDTPYAFTDPIDAASKSPIRLSDVDGSVRSLESMSTLINHLQREAYQKVRLCVPSEVRDDVLNILKRK